MRVAVYARYSSENQREASIEDQTRNYEKRATQEGWSVTHRYQDKAISGSTNVGPAINSCSRTRRPSALTLCSSMISLVCYATKLNRSRSVAGWCTGDAA